MAQGSVEIEIHANTSGTESVTDLEHAVQGVGAAGLSAGQAAGDGLSHVASSAHQAGAGVLSVSSAFNGVLNAAFLLNQVSDAAQRVGGSALELAKTADAYANLSSKIRLVTGDGSGFISAMSGVSDVAQRTSTGLEATGTLFSRLAEAGKQMGVGQAEALQLTETVNQAIQLSGASAQASDAAVTQLIQGLQGGVLRGDEFNSVMEQSPRLAKALADGLGVTTGELRKLAEAGSLSSKTVISALRDQADGVAAEFEKLPMTVGRSLTQLSNAWQLYVGESDKASGATSLAAQAVSQLAKNLPTVAGYLLDAGQAAGAFAALQLAKHFMGVAQSIVASGQASSVAAVAVGRLGVALAALKSVALVSVVANIVDIGKWLGEAASKAMGYRDRTLEVEAAEKRASDAAGEAAKKRQAMIDATQKAKDAELGLTKAASEVIAEFEKQTGAGKSAAEAVASIGKGFDLSRLPGIQSAATVLDVLKQKGLLTAKEFGDAWTVALKGLDLQFFEVSARAALDGSVRGAERLAQVFDATLAEAVRRAGLSMGQLGDGMSDASRIALSNVDTVVAGFDRLASKGVDAGLVLAKSLHDAIQTAESQNQVDALVERVNGLRDSLGVRVADGLLKEAAIQSVDLKRKLDDLVPGIGGVDEAMRKLGVTSDAELRMAAGSAKDAFDVVRSSGSASARELQLAFTKYSESAIAAHGGVADEVIKVQASMYGLEVSSDGAGKSIVRAMGSGGDSVRSFKGRVDDATSALDRQNAEMERSIELSRQLRDSEGFSAKSGQRIVAGGDLSTLTGIRNFLKSAGVSDDATATKIARQFGDRNGDVPYMNNPGQLAYGGSTLSEALLKAAERVTFGSVATGQSSTHTVNLNVGGSSTSVNVSSQADAQRLIDALKRASLSA